jgi:hypothetical protein
MVAADLIKSRTYSLWLNSHKSDTGAIIFGGYDNAKYYDDIVMLDSQSDEAFVVALTNLYIFPHNQTNAKSKREPEETSSEEASATEGLPRQPPTTSHNPSVSPDRSRL